MYVRRVGSSPLFFQIFLTESKYLFICNLLLTVYNLIFVSNRVRHSSLWNNSITYTNIYGNVILEYDCM